MSAITPLQDTVVTPLPARADTIREGDVVYPAGVGDSVFQVTLASLDDDRVILDFAHRAGEWHGPAHEEILTVRTEEVAARNLREGDLVWHDNELRQEWRRVVARSAPGTEGSLMCVQMADGGSIFPGPSKTMTIAERPAPPTRRGQLVLLISELQAELAAIEAAERRMAVA